MRIRKFTNKEKDRAKDNLWFFFGNESGLYADFFDHKLTKKSIDYYFDIYYYCYQEWCKGYEEDMSFDTVEREMCADYIAVKMGLYEPEEIFNNHFVKEMLAIEQRIEKEIEKKLRIKKIKILQSKMKVVQLINALF